MASVPANTEPARTPAPVQSGQRVAAFVPTTLEEAWRLSAALAASGMTPKAYGGDQNKIMVGIMAGAEVGLAPFTALQSIAVIGNNPSLWGDGALALVQSSGLLEDMEETDDGQTATCRVVRVGRSTPIVRTFSMADAQKAGLTGKSGPWSQYPARMRQMRARAFALRDGFADVLKGLHIAEEVRDYAPMNGGTLKTEIGATPLTGQMLIEHSTEPKQTIAEELDDSIPALDAQAPANDGTLSEDNPAAAEGPADEQRGEAHVEDEKPAWWAKVESIRNIANTAKNKQQLKDADDEFTRIRAGLPDDVIAELDQLMTDRRNALSRSAGGEG